MRLNLASTLKIWIELEYFQDSEGFDLNRGVYRIVDSLEGDQRELNRIQKKVIDMRKRQLNGITLGKFLLGEEILYYVSLLAS